MDNRESDFFCQKDSIFKIPGSFYIDSRFYSDIDFNIDNFQNERKYNNSYYSNFYNSISNMLNNENWENNFLDEIFDDSIDNNQAKLEPFEQNIGEDDNYYGGENPLNSFVLDVPQIGKNNDENFLALPPMLNLSESVINYNNEEEDNVIKKILLI